MPRFRRPNMPLTGSRARSLTLQTAQKATKAKPAMWGPAIDPERHRVLWHPHAQDPPGNPHGADVDVRLSRITVEEVLQAAEGVLAR